MNVISLLTAFGMGSLITVVVQWYLSARLTAKKRQYEERKEAYIGLLESWVRQENDGFTEDSLRDVGHWVLRAQLVASEHVYNLLCAWSDAEPGCSERIKTTQKLKTAMRDDLRTI